MSEPDQPQPLTDPSQWTGPVRPGQAPAPPRDRATTAVIVAAVAVVVTQVPGPLLAHDAQRRWREVDAAGGSPSDVTTLYERAETLGLVVLVVAWFLTCLWLSHARAVVEVRSPDSPHARSRVWVWCGWFVPVVMLWFPYQVVRDVLRVRSHPAAKDDVVSWWWSCLVFLVALRVETSLIPVDDLHSSLSMLVPASAITTVLAVVACVRWLGVVRAIAADQRTLLSSPPR